jgi:diguanylate cyclase (GGDEF)-like protein
VNSSVSSATPGSAGSAEPATAVSTDRERAHSRAFELVVEVQSAVPGAADEIEALLVEAEHLGWPEVVRAATFAAVAAAADGDRQGRFDLARRLLATAEADDAQAMIALGLALRSQQEMWVVEADAALTADEDLTRATVLLESAQGPVLERVAAHNECARGYCTRWLWELAEEQYAAALALATAAPAPPAPWERAGLPAVVYNRAEMHVHWAAVERQLHPDRDLSERWVSWEAAMQAVPRVQMPPLWATELEALGLLLGAITGRDVAGRARAMLLDVVAEEHPRARPAGWLHLAAALSDQREGRLETARRAATLAVEEIDARSSPDAYDLALCVAAELDGHGRAGAIMRYGHRQLSLRWGRRLAALGATEGRIRAERARREHDAVTEQVHLDDLTGLLNRRGFARYLELLSRQDVDEVALLVADLDRFKLVNDRFGHMVGDAVLVTVGRILHACVRQADCAVRLGGDEFAVVLASVGLDVARRRAEALAEAVRRHEWSDLVPGLAVTLSVGLATGNPAEAATLVDRADRALYAAKSSGRDGVMWHGAVGPEQPPGAERAGR